jgi:hypothetical protein
VICPRCFTPVLPGQLYVEKPGGPQTLPVHVACPTEREIERAVMWDRWRWVV